MKRLKHIVAALAAILLSSLLPSCSSDPNPVGYLNTTGEKTTIELTFNVADTRAEDANATSDETSISKVNIYVFDSSNTLESMISDIIVNNNIAVANVTPGKKTIYAVSANSLFQPDDKIKLSQFESNLFNSTLNDLKTDDGFVMVGHTTTESIQNTVTSINIPASNKIKIVLERLVAKLQVRNTYDNYASVPNFYITPQSFNVLQTNNKMRLDSSIPMSISDQKDDDSDGTFDNYTFKNSSISYLPVVSNFSATNCQYTSENIVDNPTSGNTTFVCVKAEVTPKTWYFSNSTNEIVKSDSENHLFDNYKNIIPGTTFIALGIFDKQNNFIDFLRDESDEIMCFENEDCCLRYKTNNSYKFPNTYNYEIFKYNRGEAYYRINIAEDVAGKTKKYEVQRNKFYKITINSISNLGMPNEELLRPAKASSSLDGSVSSNTAFVDATFEIKSWTSGSQSADL